jgi:hypothetical protein
MPGERARRCRRRRHRTAGRYVVSPDRGRHTTRTGRPGCRASGRARRGTGTGRGSRGCRRRSREPAGAGAGTFRDRCSPRSPGCAAALGRGSRGAATDGTGAILRTASPAPSCRSATSVARRERVGARAARRARDTPTTRARCDAARRPARGSLTRPRCSTTRARAGSHPRTRTGAARIHRRRHARNRRWCAGAAS